MEKQNWWSEEEEKTNRKNASKEIMAAFQEAEKAMKPPIEVLFSDVYKEWTPRIRKQYEDCLEHISKYPNEYPVGSYKS